MSISIQSRLSKKLSQIILLGIGFFGGLGLAIQEVEANDKHEIRARGKTLIEAEAYSAASETSPYSEPNRACSGQENLGFYWKDNWFELQVEVPAMRNYRMSFQASSPTGTQIAVLMMNPTRSGTDEIQLASIKVPKTTSWTDYTETQEVTFALPAGVHRLRFSNLEDGANIDYLTFTAMPDGDVVVDRPAKNEGPDLNPLKGFKSGWWREGETHASVGFQYIEWGKLEPNDDQFDWEYVEEVLNRPGSKGRHVILQFACDWDWRQPVEENYIGPMWLLDKVGQKNGTADPDDPASRKMRATNYNDPVFVEEAIEAINTLSAKLQNDPRCFVFQVGVLGFWGEWHTFPREDWNPTDETKRAILNTYLKHVQADGLTQIRYPDETVAEPKKGMGYTNGSVTLSDHGREFGEVIAKRELWRNGPVSGEWPPNVEKEVWKRFFETDEGSAFIDLAHYSTILPPEFKEIEAHIPGWKKEGRFMAIHRRLGYNFHVEEVRQLSNYGRSVTHVEFDLVNTGLAPFYKNWNVELAVLDAETKKVVDRVLLNADLRDLEPNGKVTLFGTLGRELDLRAEYQIALRICQPGADAEKKSAWPLEARNVYVVLSNDLAQVEGRWDESDKNKLVGGWNVLSKLQRRMTQKLTHAENELFSTEGSFGKTVKQK